MGRFNFDNYEAKRGNVSNDLDVKRLSRELINKPSSSFKSKPKPKNNSYKVGVALYFMSGQIYKTPEFTVDDIYDALQHPSKIDAQPIHNKAERKARHYKFLQKLDHIIKAEKQSGSLVNISINNEALKKIQHENNPFNEEQERVQRVDPIKTKMILDLITQGYSMTETQRLARASSTTIKHVTSDGAVKLRPIFKYQLKGTKENKLDFYTKNLRQIVNYTGIDFKKLKNENFLADRGYRLLHINKRWNQLPNGSIYSATDADNIYLKKGINSFENKELIIDRNREGK